MRTILVAGLTSAIACGSSPSQMTNPDAAGPAYIPGFNPPPVADGYTRFVTPPVHDIKPGDNLEYCQWIAAASTEPQDVLDFSGVQSKAGHHATVYATTETYFDVGETHLCTVSDMLSISFVGAAGGEGTAGDAAKLPDGLFFRLPPGQALMVNTHWLNATDETLDGQAALDFKFAPVDPQRQTADLFANNGDMFSIGAGSDVQYDVTCTLPHDINFAMVTNHMHEHGFSAYSELKHTDGTSTMLISDPAWASDEGFNPIYQRYSVAQPMVAHAGDTYHTHCEWKNDTANALNFPDEMCVGTGFYFPAAGQTVCENGQWPGN
jgi:hypothetical protein